jgi:pimeloyl-ACP methyl ester carboxylesterase
MFQRLGMLAVLLSCIGIGYVTTTDNPRIVPYRNTVQYYVLNSLDMIHPPEDQSGGRLTGVVRSPWEQPIPHATVLLPAIDGTVFTAESDAAGRYAIDAPVGRYVPVAGAPSFADISLHTLVGIGIEVDRTTPLDVTLTPSQTPSISAPTNVQIGTPEVLSIESPIPSTALRRQINFTAEGRSNQLTFLYTPNDDADTMLPMLLAVYPGPANWWEIVSLPLAQAGYAVVAVGPEYALDLETDVDDLVRLIRLAGAAQLPRVDGNRIGVFGGSYSGLHVLRLVVRHPQAVDAALLLGAPTDLFALRQQFEAGAFFPPFGLDQALIALGLPSRAPERYWRYSARYHARKIEIPLMLIHSKVDEVVPFNQSQLLADELARLDKPHELRLLDDLGHYLYEPEYRPALGDLFETTTEFFDQQLFVNNEE